MIIPAPFIWRDIGFSWNITRSAHVGRVRVGHRVLFFVVSDTTKRFQAWVEWEGGYTPSGTMPTREEALEAAREELVNLEREYHEQLLERFP